MVKCKSGSHDEHVVKGPSLCISWEKVEACLLDPEPRKGTIQLMIMTMFSHDDRKWIPTSTNIFLVLTSASLKWEDCLLQCCWFYPLSHFLLLWHYPEWYFQVYIRVFLSITLNDEKALERWLYSPRHNVGHGHTNRAWQGWVTLTSEGWISKGVWLLVGS